nr:3-dehydroquinate synthase [Candidatus Cloacimonadota bacterium]
MNEEFLDSAVIYSASQLKAPTDGVIITDQKLIELYPAIFKDTNIPLLALKAGDKNKNMAQLQIAYDFMAQNRVTRDSVVHVFGGGTITDLAGYATATFKRGCRLWLYPSTLLGMVDASIGGKCAYNHLQIQNLIGCFYPAEKIIIHYDFLKSLPAQEMRQGIAEMLKLYILLPDLPLPSLKDTPELETILRFASSKILICQDDPHDTNTRQLLNFGHSFAHALQMVSDGKILHGDAVVFGMLLSTDIAYKMGMIDEEIRNGILDILLEYPLPDDNIDLVQSYGLNDLFPYMRQDKKNASKLKLVLPVNESFKVVELDLIPNSGE